MKIANEKQSARELISDALKKAKQYEDYNIFTFVNEEKALEKAEEIDRKIKNGEKVGRLAGVPYVLKDNFLSKDGPTTASAKILESFNSPLNATVVEQLENEGAIMIGRANLDAFAHGSSTENSYFGVTKNAYDQTRVAGGSSGGSAVAIALDIAEFATGSDTGGSIRQPASFNGVYGFKPTYGAVSRYGVVAMASSTDSIGFFTKNPKDMELLMEITSKQDPKDLTSLPDFYQTSEAKIVKKIGIIKDFDSDIVVPEIRVILKDQVKKLEQLGYEIIELSLPTLKYALAVYYIVVPAEVASNLSRYDGIRYGNRSKEADNLAEVYAKSRNEGFMPENKRRIMIGNYVLSSGFYDAYYLKAAKVRTKIIQEYEEAFRQVDLILTPVSPNPAFKIGEKVNDPISMYLEDLMSVPINLAGLPSLAFPVSTNSQGLPLGLQLVGPRRSDKTILDFAKKMEQK